MSTICIAATCLATALLAGCRRSPAGEHLPRNLTVFAAASLTEAFRDLGGTFEFEHPGARVTFQFASSAALRVQIEQGAAADVFASADEPTMAALVRSGLANQPRVFAGNRLVLIARPDGPVRRPADLARPGVRLTVTAPHVPIGAYTRECLERLAAAGEVSAEFRAAVERNVVSREVNVRALFARVALGEADAAFVYATDVRSGERRVRAIPLPDAAQVRASYPLATLGDAGPLARGFVEFVLAPAGQAILARHGFERP